METNATAAHRARQVANASGASGAKRLLSNDERTYARQTLGLEDRDLPRDGVFACERPPIDECEAPLKSSDLEKSQLKTNTTRAVAGSQACSHLLPRADKLARRLAPQCALRLHQRHARARADSGGFLLMQEHAIRFLRICMQRHSSAVPRWTRAGAYREHSRPDMRRPLLT